ncbi:MAG: hypothetical protein M1839_000256 [Geoglossum umbratile]|nr:MAG: hypothetical protein M1839_000256 [Geoglossum umbratile]
MAGKMSIVDLSPTAGLNKPNVSLLPNPAQTPSPSYFGLSTGSGLLYAHVFFMVLGWMFLLPIGVMLSIAQSHIHTPVQILFLIINTLGVVLGTMYNARTPDLYRGNSHHKLGWALTWLAGIYMVVGLLSKRSAGDRDFGKTLAESASFIPVSVEAVEAHRRAHGEEPEHRRQSNDSGQGTERASSSLRSYSLSPSGEPDDHQPPSYRRFSDEVEEATTYGRRRTSFPRSNALDRIVQRIPGIPKRVLQLSRIMYIAIDRVILVLGFVALCTGAVTYGGIMRGNGIFNGLAHFIKGGIFFWYGVLTLGRWMGCFADWGWAWNIRPSPAFGRWKVPSAEFVESFVIFLYGATNVFLEHLAAWGDAWTAQDLEHVSISILFFGGGLCGMLVESMRIRDLLNTTILISPGFRSSAQIGALTPPKTYGFSLNPVPGLVIFLLGLMMGSHHQSSVTSTMWGTLLVGFAFARGITYITVYLSPPSSVLPSRPPSELIASFCLMAGGLIFMASTKDIIRAMETYKLDAMFVFTITVGFTAFYMAWIIMVVAVKGWAVRREHRRTFKSLPLE